MKPRTRIIETEVNKSLRGGANANTNAFPKFRGNIQHPTSNIQHPTSNAKRPSVKFWMVSFG
jgi:hypothetical protein